MGSQAEKNVVADGDSEFDLPDCFVLGCTPLLDVGIERPFPERLSFCIGSTDALAERLDSGGINQMGQGQINPSCIQPLLGQISRRLQRLLSSRTK